MELSFVSKKSLKTKNFRSLNIMPLKIMCWILFFVTCLTSIFLLHQKKTEINYSFVDDALNDYEKLQNKYIANGSAEVAENKVKNLTWIDDYNFLFELCQAFKYFKASRLFQKIKWRKLPSLHNARWKSKATFALLPFFLIPSHRENLEKVCNFISNQWAEVWFSNQHYKKSIYQDLLRGITQLSCPKALKCFQTH